MQINIIKKKNDNNIKRVAAYVRVSTDKYNQYESYDSQIKYYENMIKNNHNYIFVGIYADLGISGTNINRPYFNKMIDDAKNNKIDIIYVKSISRFARNASKCQEIIRELKSYYVEVIFEKENLSSFDMSCEMIFNFMTIISQEESKSISENTIWALDRLAEKGIRKLGSHSVFGYKEINGILTPNEYAPCVKIIFEEYSKGTKVVDILYKLKSLGYVKLRSKKDMNHDDIKRMLNNVIYKGDRIIQKKPHMNYITKKIDETKEFCQYYIEDSHEAIITKSLWNKCQEEQKRRKNNHYR